MRSIVFLTMALAFARADAQTMTASDVEAFLDGVLPLQLQREDIAGAAVVVVKDGKILFSKGYGYADVAQRKPATADATLFRPGSISKLFTWTSIMQLVEQKKLDLDRDVNEYIDFKIPATYPQPITLRNIMTHTPGFEEAIKDLFVAEPKDLKPLGEYLKASLPERVFPPGTTPAYSNYATALAGYILQRVSGESYEDYVERHILQPLGMARTTFRQPLPEALRPMMSNGYQVASKPAKPFEVVQGWPAGSSSTTATDMARFMIAHLQDGQYDAVRILQPETARLMHSAQFVAVPPLNSMALGFYEETRNGQRIIGHGGDTVCFHSDLHLIPAAGVGFFISYNSAGKGEISPRSAVWEKFLDRYFPYRTPEATPPADAARDAQEVSGSYQVSRRPQTSILSFISAASVTSVSVNSDGTISTGDRQLSGQPKHFREVAPLVFRQENGQDRVAFRKDSSGRMIMGVDFPFMVFEKTPWYESGPFNKAIIFGTLGVLVLIVVLWPVGAIVRWHYARPLKLAPGDGRIRWLVRLACLAMVAFALAWVSLLASLGDPGKLTDARDPLFRMIQIVGWLGVIVGIAALYDGWRALRDSERWWWSRVSAIGVAVAWAGFTWFVYHWHMLRFSLKY
ncbi:MAG: beta-lactamase family protein [Acidobacteriia bacterium]|nr:beta-lactamase family protein [Terriglobia bacterium]